MFFFVLTILIPSIIILFLLLYFQPILTSEIVLFPYAITPFNLVTYCPIFWKIIKVVYFPLCYINLFIIFNSIYSHFFRNVSNKSLIENAYYIENDINFLIGLDYNNSKVYLSGNGIFQNLLITGTIGVGKTSSVMYPLTKQLLEYNSKNVHDKFGILILDVKGNFHKEVEKYSSILDINDSIITIELSGRYFYNPLHKPNLKASVLANRLKTILTLFSPNTSESYWIDKAEQILCECIKLCRIYNNGYVTFEELHKLVTIKQYYTEKLELTRELFRTGTLGKEDCYNLLSSLEFFDKEFTKLDERTLSILKSEITRITNIFVSDYEVFSTFCPPKNKLNFLGFEDVIQHGKVVVLNLNIAEYKNLSKIIATYLKLDFQTEILSQLSNGNIKKTSFICDEFQEYVTTTDADFFAQSREAKCFNIVSTQSYSSLCNALKDNYSAKVIIQNLINKMWFRTDDIFTIEDVQKQIGKEDKVKLSRNISENAKKTSFNYLTNSLNSVDSSISESLNSYIQTDYIYDSKFFTQELEIFSCIAFISNGTKINYLGKLSTFPAFKKVSETKKDNNKFKIL